MKPLGWRPALDRDVAPLVELMRAYYSEDGYPFAEAEARGALVSLLAESGRGRVWVVEDGGRLRGYAVLTLGYSLEYLGLDAFVDELYLDPEARGAGLGRQALQLIEDECRRLGVRALHLEVERGKRGAQQLYRKWGFEDHDRYLMTKRLDGRSGAR